MVVTAMLLITIKLTTIFLPDPISDDLLQCNYCTFDLDHFDIVATDVNNFHLLVQEIKRYIPVLN